ncbi:hypothetical protein VSA01S_05680 [Vibrio sagamiensis NBRC 104589]|uniref:Uncharacterized protein n=1 Tax=Vibrio sagamiensis NBRC 104589 TaxID=1219064 RepID=A0A511QB49_9VIBR|nr:hypothetical protein VSA01S_05680 [Vibrio sagamiensis NBRC 104589]
MSAMVTVPHSLALTLAASAPVASSKSPWYFILASFLNVFYLPCNSKDKEDTANYTAPQTVNKDGGKRDRNSDTANGHESTQ